VYEINISKLLRRVLCERLWSISNIFGMFGNHLPVQRYVCKVLYIRKNLTIIIIMILAAFSMKEDKEKMIVGGLEDYISKPIELHDFIKIIEKYLVRTNKIDL
jgi:response regulator of citrate/malate metabolism